MKKVAFVSASSSGIGKAIVKELLKKGYIVYMNGRDKKKIKSLERKIDSHNLKSIIANMANETAIKESLEKIYKKEKRLDLVVANLGSGKSIPGYEINIDEYRRIFDINFYPAVTLATESIKYLSKTKGNIVFISSIAGCEYLGAPITYTSAKSALLSFSKSLATEVANLKIRVNSISPGNVLFKGSTWDDKIKNDKEAVKDYISKNVPLNKFLKPKDIAKTVVFLEENSSITGTNIVVDAGQIKKII